MEENKFDYYNNIDLNDDIPEEKIHQNSVIKKLIINQSDTYKSIKPDLPYQVQERALTSPSEPKNANNKDNIEDNLIIYKNEEIKGPNNLTYKIIKLIGSGMSGLVFKALCVENKNYYAFKVIKNKKVNLNQSKIELKLLLYLQENTNEENIIKLTDYFMYYNHLCLVFELLKENLYQLLLKKNYKGFSLLLIRFIIKKILLACEQFHRVNIIHCDLKPENILTTIKIKNGDNSSIEMEPVIKVCDFGSACFRNQKIFKHIQSRYYRSPEVIIGYPYNEKIDIWSIGCIAAELYLGLPLFKGTCEFDQLKKIIEILGDLPPKMLKNSSNLKYYYNLINNNYVIKSDDEYYKDLPSEYLELKKRDFNFYNLKSLDDIINIKGKNNSNNNILVSFIHFLKVSLELEPENRWSASELLKHPFFTGEKLDEFLREKSKQKLNNYSFAFNNSGNFNNSMYHSMMMNNTFYNYINRNNNNNNFMNKNNFNNSFNIGYNNMYGSSNNSSFSGNYNFNNNNMMNYSYNIYQPNMNNIQLAWMKFPYALIEQTNLRPNMNYNNNSYNRMNNTFMNSTFEKINSSYDYNTMKTKKKKYPNKKSTFGRRYSYRNKNKSQINYNHNINNSNITNEIINLNESKDKDNSNIYNELSAQINNEETNNNKKIFPHRVRSQSDYNGKTNFESNIKETYTYKNNNDYKFKDQNSNSNNTNNITNFDKENKIINNDNDNYINTEVDSNNSVNLSKDINFIKLNNDFYKNNIINNDNNINNNTIDENCSNNYIKDDNNESSKNNFENTNDENNINEESDN